MPAKAAVHNASEGQEILPTVSVNLARPGTHRAAKAFARHVKVDSRIEMPGRMRVPGGLRKTSTV